MEPIQISHKHTKAETEHKDIAIGIDFGTTYSVVAFSKNKKVQILEDQSNKRLIPSIVAINNLNTLVGNEVKALEQDDSTTIIRSIKRLIGKGIEDITTEYDYFKTIINKDKSSKELIAISTNSDNTLSPVIISSKILTHLKTIAETRLKQSVTKAVITVPAHFNEHQRNSVKYASELAGLQILRVLNEPTAAAVAYGLDKKTEGNYIIYDFGGGTFDISILEMNKGVFKVIATNGDNNLGGDDIDYLIAQHIKKTIKTHKLKDIELLDKSRHLKEILSKKDTASIDIAEHPISLTRQELDKIIETTIAKTIKITRDTIDDSNLDDIDGIILVGGSSRIPLISQKLKEIFPDITIYNDINPDEVVAQGAALQAESLTHGASHLLLDVNPLSLGIELADGTNERIIERNTTIPVSVTKTYTTYKDNQTGLILNIIQGERELAKDCRSLGKLEVKNIPPMKAGTARVSITFSLDADNLLTIKSVEELTGLKQETQFLSSYKLGIQDIEDMLYDSIEHAQDDIDIRLITNTIFKAQSIIEQALNSIKEDCDLVTKKEKEKIEMQCETIKKAINTKKIEKINQAIETLEKIMIKFNTRKINKYVNFGLKGVNISNLKNN
jgi:molecular chaperone HscA